MADALQRKATATPLSPSWKVVLDHVESDDDDNKGGLEPAPVVHSDPHQLKLPKAYPELVRKPTDAFVADAVAESDNAQEAHLGRTTATMNLRIDIPRTPDLVGSQKYAGAGFGSGGRGTISEENCGSVAAHEPCPTEKDSVDMLEKVVNHVGRVSSMDCSATKEPPRWPAMAERRPGPAQPEPPPTPPLMSDMHRKISSQAILFGSGSRYLPEASAQRVGNASAPDPGSGGPTTSGARAGNSASVRKPRAMLVPGYESSGVAPLDSRAAKLEESVDGRTESVREDIKRFFSFSNAKRHFKGGQQTTEKDGDGGKLSKQSHGSEKQSSPTGSRKRRREEVKPTSDTPLDLEIYSPCEEGTSSNTAQANLSPPLGPTDSPSVTPASADVAEAGVRAENVVREPGTDAEQAPSELEELIQSVSKTKGIHLPGLLCAITVFVAVLFILVIFLVSITANDTLSRMGRGAAQGSAAETENQVRVLLYGLAEALFAVEHLYLSEQSSARTLSVGDMGTSVCVRLLQTPVAYAAYNPDGHVVWKHPCPSSGDFVVPSTFTRDSHLAESSVRIAANDADPSTIIAYIISRNLGTPSIALVAYLGKEGIGEMLMSNSLPEYSSATLRKSKTAIMFNSLNGTNKVVGLHTLSVLYPTYSVNQPSQLAVQMMDVFQRVCADGNAYTWHVVNHISLREDEEYSSMDVPEYNLTTLNPIPEPDRDYKGSLHYLSRMTLCGIVCGAMNNTHKCLPDNPTNVYFVVEAATLTKDIEVIVGIVTAISVGTMFLFIFTSVLTYLSVTVPIHYLKWLIHATIASKKRKTKRARMMYRLTRMFWIGDLQALVRAFGILSICFRLNKKYVPMHVQRQQACDLKQNMRDYFWKMLPEDDDDSATIRSPRPEPRGAMPVDGEEMEDITAFVNTFSAADMRRVRGRSFLAVDSRRDGSPREDGALSMQGPGGRKDSTLVLPNVCAITDHDGMDSEFVSDTYRIPIGDRVDAGSGVQGAMRYNASVGKAMSIVECATILSIHLCAVELAYMTNFYLSVKQHRRIMSTILSKIRQYRGEIFLRSGDQVAVAWNAFDSRGDHAERATACALDIARAFSHLRHEGLRMGIALHQGPFICGVIEDDTEAFATVFGTVPYQGIQLAELASSLTQINVLATEPVKQSIGALYEFMIVDVVLCRQEDNVLVLFDVRSERKASPKESSTLVASPFAADYARIFFDFRTHNYDRALEALQEIRPQCPLSERGLLARLEGLCRYYREHPEGLPMPYYRPFPTWIIYEDAPATAEALGEPVCGSMDSYAESSVRLRGSVAEEIANGAENSPVYLQREDRWQVGKLLKTPFEDEGDKFKRELLDNMKEMASRKSMSATPVLKPANLRSFASASPQPPESGRATPALATPAHSQSLQPALQNSFAAAGTPAKAGASTDASGRRVTLDEAADDVMLGAFNASDRAPWDTRRSGGAQIVPRASSCTNQVIPPRSPAGARASLSANEGGTSNGGRSTAETPSNWGSIPGEGVMIPLSLSQVGKTCAENLSIESEVKQQSTAVDPKRDVACLARSSGCDATPDSTSGAVATSLAAAGAGGGSSEKMSGSEREALGTDALVTPTSALLGEDFVGAPDDPNRFALTNNHLMANLSTQFGEGTQHVCDLPPCFNVDLGKLQQACERRTLGETPCSEPLQRVTSVASFDNGSVFAGSIIQSIGLTANGPNGEAKAVPVQQSFPVEVRAKNGITYLRSSRILGRGSFGCVFLGMDVHCGRLVAIKFLPMPSDEVELGNVEREVLTMQRVKNSHLVEFISYAFQNGMIIIIMECMMAGSLQNMISCFGSIPSSTARVFIRDVLRGLHRLHSAGVIHRDVKPQNVLLSLAGHCKISDFGAASWLAELARKQLDDVGLEIQGTPAYLAPEAARGKPEAKSDIWSCGVMYIQLLTGKLPYEKDLLRMPPPIVVFSIGSGTVFPTIPDTLGEFDQDFVHHCLHNDPKERWPAIRLLELPMFAL